MPGQPALPSAQPQPPTAPPSTQGQPGRLEMQPYRDPGGRFTIAYPRGWQVQASPEGNTDFYKDDPEEGTTFTVFPHGVVQGEGRGAQVVDYLVQVIRQSAPDFQITGQQVQQGERGDTGILEGMWTNHRGERMRGLMVFRTSLPGDGTTVLRILAYQAPAVVMPAMEPIFNQMLQSYKGE